MRRILLFLAVAASLWAQQTVIPDPFAVGTGLQFSNIASGTGTVTGVSITGTTNQIKVTGTCTGVTVITCILGLPSNVVLPGTINGVTITTATGAATITIANAKTFSVGNTLAFTGTDASTINFPNPASVTNGDCVIWTKSGSTINFTDNGACPGGAAAGFGSLAITGTTTMTYPSAATGNIYTFTATANVTASSPSTNPVGMIDGYHYVVSITDGGGTAYSIIGPSAFTNFPANVNANSVTVYSCDWSAAATSCLNGSSTTTALYDSPAAVTFASLPATCPLNVPQTAWITDSTTSTLGGTVAGSGSALVFAGCFVSGGNWIVLGAAAPILPLVLTTTGSSGAASLSGNTLNVPQYSGGSTNYFTTNPLQGYDDFCLYDSSSAGTAIHGKLPYFFSSNNSGETATRIPPGCGIQLATSATSGYSSFLFLDNFSTPVPSTTIAKYLVIFSTSDAAHATFAFSLGNDNGVLTGGTTNGISVQALAGSSFVTLETCVSSACTSTSSGVAYTTNAIYKATMTTDGAGNACIQVTQGATVGTSHCATAPASAPSSSTLYQMGVLTNTTASVNANLLYWAYQVPGY